MSSYLDNVGDADQRTVLHDLGLRLSADIVTLESAIDDYLIALAAEVKAAQVYV